MKSKLPVTNISIFAKMSNLAMKYNAINLSQGFPNYSSDSSLFDLVKFYMDKGFNQYAPLQGVQELRDAICDKIGALYQNKLDANTEVCITSGATQAVYTAIQTFIHQGDEAIIFDPSFDVYSPDVVLAGGKPKRIPLFYPDFKIDWDRIEREITSNTKLLILNSPNNPTGYTLSEYDIKRLEKIIKENHQIYLLSDEVYEHLTFDGLEHNSILNHPSLYNRSIITFSFGKTFHNTGWKIGYAVASEKIMREFKKIHQFIVYSVNTPIQFALAEFLKTKSHYHDLPEIYEAKRDYFLELISASKFKFIPTKGTYFQLLDYSDISQEMDIDFSERLIKEFGVATIPLSSFYEINPEQKLLRVCFAKTEDVLKSATEKLCKI